MNNAEQYIKLLSKALSDISNASDKLQQIGLSIEEFKNRIMSAKLSLLDINNEYSKKLNDQKQKEEEEIREAREHKERSLNPEKFQETIEEVPMVEENQKSSDETEEKQYR